MLRGTQATGAHSRLQSVTPPTCGRNELPRALRRTLSMEVRTPMKIRHHSRALTFSAAMLGALLAPPVVSAQSALDVAEARSFLGAWALAMTSDMGNFVMNLDVTDAGGKVAAVIASPDIGMEQNVTDITKSGESLVLAFEGSAQGQVFQAE